MAYAQIGTFSNSRKIINYSVGIFVNLFILRAGYVYRCTNSSLDACVHLIFKDPMKSKIVLLSEQKSLQVNLI